ncbi:hypothetical protein U0035_01905 [Niabella yanshanensis]|uniref:Uncharacterized protein n=1 Tax=Niabella yanshanensis TaxID=577386 RepID=A0ABZ0WBF2_9BACT|nr:hypothetical protein [Niabella yanshanensis]WQD38897.1 hypothetical protein U0035_01905 [Niabella yanshanensis]
MTIQFINTIPPDIYTSPVLISGVTSSNYPHHQFLLAGNNNQQNVIYEIRYLIQCSPFREALAADHLLAVGHQEHFYLFDTIDNKPLQVLKVNDYFGHLYYNDQFFYVTDSCGVYCIDKTGHILWANLELAIDGVVIDTFEAATLSGKGEFDPPGGWKAFRIDKNTGAVTWL